MITRMRTAVVAGLGFLSAWIAPALASDPGDVVPKQAVIRMNPGEDIGALIDPTKVFVKASFPAHLLYLLEARPGHDGDLDHLVDQYQSDHRVGGCEKNTFNGSVEGSTQSFFVRVPPPIDYAAQPAGRKLGLPTALSYGTGSGVTVAILDTGLSPHSYLSGHVLPGYDWLNGVADTSDTADGIDQDQDGIADEMTGHGTFVAGIIHTAAPGAQILPVKVLNSDGQGTTFALTAGIYYAVDRGAKVINISLTSPEESSSLDDAVAAALARGVVVIAAVSNEGRGRRTYPAATPGVIAVASIDLTDHLAPGSDHGEHISLCAPGLNVVSVLPGEQSATADGTSFSAAFVSGIATLTVAKQPWLTPAALRARLMAHAVNIDALNPGFAGELGAGRVTTWGLTTGLRPPGNTKLAP